MNKPEENSRGPKPLPRELLLSMANRIAHVAIRCREIADESTALKAGDLQVTGTPTAERGIGFLDDWLDNLGAALESLRRKSLAGQGELHALAALTNADEEELSKRPPPKKPKQPRVEK